MAPKTLLLVYIHGFKGDDNTFQNFPSHLTALLSHRLPHLNIRHSVFPTFETRGDLSVAVQSFRTWLENQVIDLEVDLGTPSPTVDPGVGVIIVGHSMGGIVGVEATLGVAGERVIGHPDSTNSDTSKEEEGDAEGMARGAQAASEAGEGPTISLEGEKTSLLFPFIQGVLAFDTPYLGICPGVVAYGAEGHWKEGKAWYDGAMGVIGAFGTATAAGAGSKGANETSAKIATQRGLPPTESKADEETSLPTSPPTKQKSWTSNWGRTALLASAGIAATTALGAAAYAKRDNITSGFTWVSSHLQYVGCLARGGELRERLEKMLAVSQERKLGFANLHTLLADDKGSDRTFCNLPRKDSRLSGVFRVAKNEKAKDEVSAHIYMFTPKENPSYYAMGEQALDLITSWIPGDQVQKVG